MLEDQVETREMPRLGSLNMVNDVQSKTKIQLRLSVMLSNTCCFVCDENHFAMTCPMEVKLETYLGEFQG